MPFPADFRWGCATAAYQIEGGWNEDGRGPSIWDTFAHTPGRVRNGDTGDVACDSYRRWAEDVALLQRIGANAYRFSISWSRVLPAGWGRVNEPGLAYYERLVDALLAAGIEPFVTLYHWDLPQALQDEGGWGSRDTADAFVEFAGVVARRLGDRVKRWITLNEPWVVAHVGHAEGVHAPGLSDWALAYRVAHHLLLAHGRAVPLLRGFGGQVGITLNLAPVEPASERPEDVAAARRVDGHLNRWYLDALYHGAYPSDLLAWLEERGCAPPVGPGDLLEISAPTHFLGVNYYSRRVVAHDPAHRWLESRSVPPTGATTAMGWEVFPEGLEQVLTRVWREYRPPAIYITENGAAFDDTVGPDGQVRDEPRVRYLEAHLRVAERAIEQGVPLQGYFVWSLLDNFEWAEGYAKRFGLVYVDYPTQRRILKDSAHFYRRFIAGARAGTARP